MSTINNKIENTDKSKYSLKIHVSYSLGSFFDAIFAASFIVRVIYYYENELFLSIVLVGIAFISYGFWNMINDPLIGWITDKGTRFTKRWGRRFPWFLIGSISMIFIYVLIYTVPFDNQLGMFIWLLVIICLYELCYSLWQVSWLSLYPDKFRTHKERMRIGALTTMFTQTGTVLGVVISPLFITYGDVESYIIAAIVVAMIGLVIFLLIIPGMREDEDLIMRELKNIQEQKEKKDSFIQIVKFSIKDKNFVVYVLWYLAFYMIPLLMMASLPFWTIYIIKTKNPMTETMLAGSFIGGALLSIPIWLKIGRKIGSRKMFIYGTLMASLAFIPLLFVSELIITLILLFIIGVFYGSSWTVLYPGFSDVIDGLVIKSGKRREGAYTGIRTFIGRLSFVLQAAIFAIVHTTTNYEAGATTQTPLALWGIRIIMVLAPMLFLFFGFLIMAIFYDLTPERVNANKTILKERNL
ncbi:MAG: MFS transporter [Candidatus Hermodarchaeota archaeon]